MHFVPGENIFFELISSWCLLLLSFVPAEVFIVLFLIETINFGTLSGESDASSEFDCVPTTLSEVSDGNLGVVDVANGIFNFRRTFFSSSPRGKSL